MSRANRRHQQDEEEAVHEAIASATPNSRGWVRAGCPFCFLTSGKKDSKASLGAHISGFFHCFSGDTPMLVHNNTVEIGALAGTEADVLTADAAGIPRWQPASIESFGVQELWEIKLRRNQITKTIRTTSDHRWFTRVGGVGFQETTTRQLTEGMRLRHVRFPHSGNIKPTTWGIAHGFTFGDGTLLHGVNGSRAYFHGEKDQAMIPYFHASALVCPGEGRSRIDGLPRFFKSRPSLNEAPGYLYGFLAGYFAADGCVDTTGAVSLASADRSNLEWVRRVCSRLGIFTYGIKEQLRCGYGEVPSSLFQLSFSRNALNEAFFLLPKHRARWLANTDVVERPGWVVDEVYRTGRREEVFCASVPSTANFALEDNILTGNCFKCGTAGKLHDLADWMDREKKIEQGDIKRFDPPPTFTPLGFEPGRSARVFAQARNYLRGRGILEDTWFDCGLGVCLKGRDRGRVVVPILAPNGFEWYGYVGRDYTGKAERKYLYPPEMSRAIILYEERALDALTDRPVLVVEGVFDVLPYFGDAVALLGKPSEWQIDRLTKTARPVAVVLDGDAFEEGFVLAARLRMAGQRAGYVKLPPKVDPDEVSREWLFEQAQRAVETGEGGVL